MLATTFLGSKAPHRLPTPAAAVPCPGIGRSGQQRFPDER